MASELTLNAPPGGVIRVTARSGNVRVTGEERGDVVVTGARGAKVEDDGSVEVKSKSGSVKVRCPEGSDVIVGANSGSVELRGRLGYARVTVGSGSVVVDHVERLDARTGSGSGSTGPVTSTSRRCRDRSPSAFRAVPSPRRGSRR